MPVLDFSGVDPNVKKSIVIESVKRVSPIAAAIEGLAIGEFKGMQFVGEKSLFGWKRLRDVSKVGGVGLVQNGEQVLEALGLKGLEFGAVMVRMVVGSLYVLSKQIP